MVKIEASALAADRPKPVKAFLLAEPATFADARANRYAWARTRRL